MGQMTQPNSV